jgi:hypothetical protein
LKAQHGERIDHPDDWLRGRGWLRVDVEVEVNERVNLNVAVKRVKGVGQGQRQAPSNVVACCRRFEAAKFPESGSRLVDLHVFSA